MTAIPFHSEDVRASKEKEVTYIHISPEWHLIQELKLSLGIEGEMNRQSIEYLGAVKLRYYNDGPILLYLRPNPWNVEHEE